MHGLGAIGAVDVADAAWLSVPGCSLGLYLHRTQRPRSEAEHASELQQRKARIFLDAHLDLALFAAAAVVAVAAAVDAADSSEVRTRRDSLDAPAERAEVAFGIDDAAAVELAACGPAVAAAAGIAGAPLLLHGLDVAASWASASSRIQHTATRLALLMLLTTFSCTLCPSLLS